MVGVSADGAGRCVGPGGKDRDGPGVNRVGGAVVTTRTAGGAEAGGCPVRSVESSHQLPVSQSLARKFSLLGSENLNTCRRELQMKMKDRQKNSTERRCWRH